MFNTLTFVYITGALAGGAYSLYDAGEPTAVTFISVSTTIPAFVLNMLHSQQLSLMPKFLLKNDPDNPLQQIEIFRKLFGELQTD